MFSPLAEVVSRQLGESAPASARRPGQQASPCQLLPEYQPGRSPPMRGPTHRRNQDLHRKRLHETTLSTSSSVRIPCASASEGRACRASSKRKRAAWHCKASQTRSLRLQQRWGSAGRALQFRVESDRQGHRFHAKHRSTLMTEQGISWPRIRQRGLPPNVGVGDRPRNAPGRRRSPGVWPEVGLGDVVVDLSERAVSSRRGLLMSGPKEASPEIASLSQQERASDTMPKR